MMKNDFILKEVIIILVIIIFSGCKTKEKTVRIPVKVNVIDSVSLNSSSINLPFKKEFTGKIYFRFDKWNIEKEYEGILDSFIDYSKNKKGIIKIVGHTDQIGSNSYNDNLSLKRAMSVYDYIRYNLGEENFEYEIEGMGKKSLIYSGKDRSQNIQNRRVSVTLYSK